MASEIYRRVTDWLGGVELDPRASARPGESSTLEGFFPEHQRRQLPPGAVPQPPASLTSIYTDHSAKSVASVATTASIATTAARRSRLSRLSRRSKSATAAASPAQPSIEHSSSGWLPQGPTTAAQLAPREIYAPGFSSGKDMGIACGAVGGFVILLVVGTLVYKLRKRSKVRSEIREIDAKFQHV